MAMASKGFESSLNVSFLDFSIVAKERGRSRKRFDHLFVANAARRWSAAKDVQAASSTIWRWWLPQAVRSSLGSQRRHAVECCERRPSGFIHHLAMVATASDSIISW
jgi:hypothetical protein